MTTVYRILVLLDWYSPHPDHIDSLDELFLKVEKNRFG